MTQALFRTHRKSFWTMNISLLIPENGSVTFLYNYAIQLIKKLYFPLRNNIYKNYSPKGVNKIENYATQKNTLYIFPSAL